jgi:serine protease Do
MQKRYWGTACALVVAIVISGAGTEARAEYQRRTAIVEAVEKTHKSIIVINSVKRNQYGVKKNVTGTGVIIDERGYAVTNRHVVNGAEKLDITLYDGTELTASVFATDPQNDVAILKLSGGKKYHELGLAPASDLMVGETVIAVGNPLGYTNTVSTGIVSALGRDVDMGEGLVLKGLIQTNASINPGNSGGPLLNINGELIGINVAMHQGAQNISFALNADTVKGVLARHLSAARMSKLSHGLTCREEVPNKGKVRQQVVIDKVAPKSPAAAAGLKPGDVLVKMAGKAVANRFDVERALWDTKAGQKIEATVLREGKETAVAIALEKVLGERVTQTEKPATDKSESKVKAVGNDR